MKTIFIFFIFLFCASELDAQMDYDATASNPYGALNPKAPKETGDYAPLIGICDCISTARKADQSWGEPQQMTWTFKYIMNGMAVQDETLKSDGSHSGSIRQFIADSSKWYVHWYSNNTPSTILPTWEGTKKGDSLVLYKPQKAPNGMDGNTRLTFKNISEDGFNWILEWVNPEETIVYPTWRIDCKKRNEAASAKKKILENTAAFSQAYMNNDLVKLVSFYTDDAKLFPGNSKIISGKLDVMERWKFVETLVNPVHKVTPSEVKIIGNYAYDYGYYEGSSENKKGEISSFSGKYVIVWRKEGDDWKMYLDIWNRTE